MSDHEPGHAPEGDVSNAGASAPPRTPSSTPSSAPSTAPSRTSQPPASRREFLRRAAALAAAGSAIDALRASDVLAAAGEAPLPRALTRAPLGGSEPIRIGVIGTGGMGREHCRAFVRLTKDGRADVRIAALSDVCAPRLAETLAAIDDEYAKGEAASPPPAPAAYTDYRQLLADPAIDGVLIATPEHWHARMAEAAIAAGKDVYIEKPMTLRLPEALRLRRVAHANPDAILAVGTQYVMEPAYAEAHRLIAAGAIGKPVSSQTSYCRNSRDGEWLYYDIDPDWQPGVNLDWNAWCGPLGRQPWDPEVYARWRRYRRYSTGIIGDLLVHRIAPLVMALDVGWPTRVVASGGHYVDKAMENHDQINMNIEFEGEHTMLVAGSTCNEVGLETLIRGHRANLYLAGRRLTLRPERIFAEEIEEHSYESPDAGNPQDLLRLHWLDCMRSREQPASGIELATRIMVAVDLATRSLWERRAFAFDPRRMRTVAL